MSLTPPLGSQGAREALDAIISSIPALKELRYQLGKASPPNSQQRMQNRKVDVEAWQAKPSVVNAGRPELEAVTETTERGSDSETGSVVAGAGRALRWVRTHAGKYLAWNSELIQRFVSV